MQVYIWVSANAEGSEVLRREAMLAIENYLATSKFPRTPVVLYFAAEGAAPDAMPFGLRKAFGQCLKLMPTLMRERVCGFVQAGEQCVIDIDGWLAAWLAARLDG